jgi:hypothetical protein
MSKLISAVLCSRVIIDQQTNLVSYIDILDGVHIFSFPFKAPLVIAGTIWQIENEKKIEVRVRVFSPDNDHLIDSTSAQMDILPGIKHARMNVAVAGFNIGAIGTYQFAIEHKISGKWHEITRIPMDVYSKKMTAGEQ